MQDFGILFGEVIFQENRTEFYEVEKDDRLWLVKPIKTVESTEMHAAS